MRLRLRGVDDNNTLSGSEAARLDDDWSALAPDVLAIERRFREGRIARGWDVVPAQEFLGEGLGPFELRGRFPRAEALQACPLKLIDDANDEWGFRADDRQINMFGARDRDEPGDIIGGDFDIANLGFVRGAGITRRDENLTDARGGGAFPGQRMLASPPSR